MSSLLQNLPTKAYGKKYLSECIKRFRKTIETPLTSSSKLQAMPGLENILMRWISPWSNPRKMHKHHSTQRRHNTISQNLSEELSMEPFKSYIEDVKRKRKIRELIIWVYIAIQEETLIIRKKKGEYIFKFLLLIYRSVIFYHFIL